MQESYLGKVKMIYIDPPYNTGNDLANGKPLREQEELSDKKWLLSANEKNLFENKGKTRRRENK